MGNEFKAGDTVRLKSGGPLMTVESVGDHYGTTKVWCSWFQGTKLENGTFAVEAVEKSAAGQPVSGGRLIRS